MARQLINAPDLTADATASAPSAAALTQANDPYASGISVAGVGPNGAASNIKPVWDAASGTWAIPAGAGGMAPIYSASQYAQLMKNPQALGNVNFQQTAQKYNPNSGTGAPSGMAYKPGGGLQVVNQGGGSTNVSYRLDPATGMYVPSAEQGVGQKSWWQSQGLAEAALLAASMGAGALAAPAAAAGEAGTGAAAGEVGAGGLGSLAPTAESLGAAAGPSLTDAAGGLGAVDLGGAGAASAAAIPSADLGSLAPTAESLGPASGPTLADAGASGAAAPINIAGSAGGLGSALNTAKTVGSGLQALGKLGALGAGAAAIGKAAAPANVASTGASTTTLPGSPGATAPNFKLPPAFSWNGFEQAQGAPSQQMDPAVASMLGIRQGDPAQRAFSASATPHADGGSTNNDYASFDPGYAAMIAAAPQAPQQTAAAPAPAQAIPVAAQDPLAALAKTLQSFGPQGDVNGKPQLNGNQRNEIAAHMAALQNGSRPLSPTILRHGMASGFADGGSVLSALRHLFSSHQAPPSTTPGQPPVHVVSNNGFGSPGDTRYGNGASEDTPNPSYTPTTPQVNAINGKLRADQIDQYVNSAAGDGHARGGAIMCNGGLNMADGGGFMPPGHLGANTRQEAFAGGGTQAYLSGGASGQSDTVPAKLSHGEYVMDADVVSALGDGNNAAGAAQLDQMRQNIRTQKRGAPSSSIPPKAKAPMAYLGKGKK